MKFTVYVLALLSSFTCLGSTFIVTSNADSGPGTLREAVKNAAVNGTSTADSIWFSLNSNLPEGTTIKLLSDLPILTSNIILDGSTQTGESLGVSDARVTIHASLDNTVSNVNAIIKISNCNNIGIYSINFSTFTPSLPADLYLRRQTAIEVENSTNITIGKPGKGNVINGFNYAISSNSSLCSDISIQSNIIGLECNGFTSLLNNYNTTGLRLWNCKDVRIGGSGANRNIICSWYADIDIGTQYRFDNGNIVIENNFIGTDITGQVAPQIGLSQYAGSSLSIMSLIPNGILTEETYSDYSVIIKDNVISKKTATGAIDITGISKFFSITGNKFGTDVTGTKKLSEQYSVVISLICSPNGLIGGVETASKNIIAYGKFYGVNVTVCRNVSILGNNFFCNGGKDINVPDRGNYQPPIIATKISITEVTPFYIKGTTNKAGSRIEAFYTLPCSSCSPQFWLDSARADANGNWVVPKSARSTIMVTATSVEGSTSEFASTTIYKDSFYVVNAYCGKSNGKIINNNLSEISWKWMDQSGNIVGYAKDLENVPAGKYRLKAIVSCGASYSEVISKLLEISDRPAPSLDTTKIVIVNPSCSIPNGSLNASLVYNNNWIYKLVNVLGAQAGDWSNSQQVSQLSAGEYFLKIKVKDDTSCSVSYGPFKLIDQPAPDLNIDNIQINPATCNQSNGAITNIFAQNSTGNPSFLWEDTTGLVIANSLNLINKPIGQYRLKLKDQSTCDTVVSPFFAITSTGEIKIDSSLMVINISECNKATGSITNIKITGADTYEWKNINTGKTTGDSINLINQTTGLYQLTATNHFNCNVIGLPVFIPEVKFLPLTVTAAEAADANCGLKNGYIRPIRFSQDTSLYSFRWIELNGVVLGFNTQISTLPEGSYRLIATDNNGCSKEVFSKTLKGYPKPEFNYSNLLLLNDTCNQNKGLVWNLSVVGAGDYTWSWRKNGNDINISRNQIDKLSKGHYQANVQDKFGCRIKSNTFDVNNININLQVPVADDKLIRINTSAQIIVKNPLLVKYSLFDDAAASSLLADNMVGMFTTPPVSADKAFYIRSSIGFCMSALKVVKVKVGNSPQIKKLPNVFSPNGDGVNDSWKIGLQEGLFFKYLIIYNRFGQKIFFSNNILEGWNGKFRGMPVPVGTYYWIVAALENQKEIELKGALTILR